MTIKQIFLVLIFSLIGLSVLAEEVTFFGEKAEKIIANGKILNSETVPDFGQTFVEFITLHKKKIYACRVHTYPWYDYGIICEKLVKENNKN